MIHALIVLTSLLLLFLVLKSLGHRPIVMLASVIWSYPEYQLQVMNGSVVEVVKWSILSILQFLAFIGFCGVLSGRYF